MKAILAFTLRAATLWQFAPSKLLRAQKVAGAIFNREATRRAKCRDALGKEKVTKKAARERSDNCSCIVLLPYIHVGILRSRHLRIHALQRPPDFLVFASQKYPPSSAMDGANAEIAGRPQGWGR